MTNVSSIDHADHDQKSDLWLAESASSAEGVRGAVGFRKMKDSAVFATGQPTEEGLSTILKAVHERCPTVNTIVWVCLREEPLVMINGKLVPSFKADIRLSILP